MAERASVFQGVQLGPETTPGTVVAATKKLLGFQMAAKPKVPSEVVFPQGQIGADDLVLGKDWSEADIKGMLCYNDLVYLLGSLLLTVAPTTPANNEVWTVTLGTQSSGTFKLTYGGQQTGTIAYNATAATVLTALQALSSIGATNAVTVTGAVGGPYTITFPQGMAPITAVTADFTALTTPGNASIASTAATNTRRWTFLPSQTQADTNKTFTVENGVLGVEGSQFAYGFCSELEITLPNPESGKAITLSGKWMGQRMVDGFTMTAALPEVAIVAASPAELTWYLSNDNITYTSLARALEGKISIKNRWKTVMTQIAADTSFSTVVQQRPQVDAQITMEQDATGDQAMTDLRARTKKYLKMVLKGQLVEAGYSNRLLINMPFKYREPDRQDSNALWAGVYNLQSINDAAFGGYISAIVDNAIAAY